MSQIKANIQVSPQDLFSHSATPGTDIGAYVTTGDGRGFRYCRASATALVAGKLYQAQAENTTNLQNLTVSAALAAATSITTASTVTLTANQLAGAFLVVTASTGAGYTYKVTGNTAATAATTTIYLEDPLIAAVAATSTIDIQPNPYTGVVVDPTTATSAPMGVAVYPISATWYGWIQTHGPVACLAQGALAVGTSVTAANSTNAGAVASATATTAVVMPVVGYALTGVATTEYGQIFLTID